MILIQLLAPYGALTQNLVLLFLAAGLLVTGYAWRDGQRARRNRRRLKRDRRLAEYNYRMAHKAADNAHLVAPPQDSGAEPTVVYLARVAPERSSGAA